MKVTLTLNRGSFYFLKNLHLVRDVPTDVDLTTLEAVELTGLKQHVKAGTIVSDKDIEGFEVKATPSEQSKVEPKVETKATPKVEPKIEVETKPKAKPKAEPKAEVEKTEEPEETTKKK